MTKEYFISPTQKCQKHEVTKLTRLIIKENCSQNGHQKIIDYLSSVKKLQRVLNTTNGDFKWTALMVAVRNVNHACSIETVKLLVKLGGDNYVNKEANRITALMIVVDYSLYAGNLDTVKLLLDSGAKINLRGYRENTALYIACRNSNMEMHVDPNVIPLLLQYGADVNILTQHGSSPYIAFIEQFPTPDKHSHIKKLLKDKFNPNKKINGIPLLMNSILGKNIKYCKLLIENGADINIRDNNGNSCLMLACKNDKLIDIMILLINNGADLSLRNNTGENCFIIASKFHNFKAMKILFDYNCDYLTRDKSGCNVFNYLNDSTNDFIKLHDQKQFIKQYMKIVCKDIQESAQKFILRPDGIRAQLLNLKWIRENYTDSIMSEYHEILNYFGIYDEKSLADKINNYLEYHD